MAKQVRIGSDVEFAENQQPRCPCVLLLDTSASMDGTAIRQLNGGLQSLRDDLAEDSLASKRVEVSIITFGEGVSSPTDFTLACNFTPPMLHAGGHTPMGEAIEAGIDRLAERKQNYRAHAITYYRPWVFLITDGAPTDNWHRAAARVREGEERREFAFFAVGVEGASIDTLAKIAVRPPLKLDGLKFRDMFQWISSSLKAVSASRIDDRVRLPPPGWAEV